MPPGFTVPLNIELNFNEVATVDRQLVRHCLPAVNRNVPGLAMVD